MPPAACAAVVRAGSRLAVATVVAEQVRGLRPAPGAGWRRQPAVGVAQGLRPTGLNAGAEPAVGASPVAGRRPIADGFVECNPGCGRPTSRGHASGAVDLERRTSRGDAHLPSSDCASATTHRCATCDGRRSRPTSTDGWRGPSPGRDCTSRKPDTIDDGRRSRPTNPDDTPPRIGAGPGTTMPQAPDMLAVIVTPPVGMIRDYPLWTVCIVVTGGIPDPGRVVVTPPIGMILHDIVGLIDRPP